MVNRLLIIVHALIVFGSGAYFLISLLGYLDFLKQNKHKIWEKAMDTSMILPFPSVRVDYLVKISFQSTKDSNFELWRKKFLISFFLLLIMGVSMALIIPAYKP